MYEIKHRFDGRVLYSSEGAETLRDCVLEAVQKGVNLSGAHLSCANLSGANLSCAKLSGAVLSGVVLSGANLSGVVLSGVDLSGADLCHANLFNANLFNANLSGAYLSNADLSGAYLSNAYLSGANLSNAYLSGASLYRASLSNADLSNANLSGVDLYRVNLSGVDLYLANLSGIKQDLFKVLNDQPNEVEGLLKALQDGNVDGSTYEGVCACLVGTIANVAGQYYEELKVRPDADRPIERFFLGIRKGDTPSTNQISAIVEGWIKEWQSARLELEDLERIEE